MSDVKRHITEVLLERECDDLQNSETKFLTENSAKTTYQMLKLTNIIVKYNWKLDPHFILICLYSFESWGDLLL